MNKINFQDGTKVSSAKVTIDEVDYPVTPARYTGATPLSSVVMNTMQDNIEDAINQNTDNIGGEEYDETRVYYTGDITKHEGQLYIANQDILEPEEFDPTKWDATDVLSSAGGNEVYIGSKEDAPYSAKYVTDTTEGTDAYSEVVNSLSGNEIAKAPSVRAVNEALANTEIYSTEEVRIGTWLGKPLYRKVYTGTIATEGTNYNYNDITGLSNTIDKIVGFSGYADNNGTGGNRISNSIPNMWINATYFPAEHRIRVYSYDKNWFNTNTSYYLVVEYTKTTDI